MVQCNDDDGCSSKSTVDSLHVTTTTGRGFASCQSRIGVKVRVMGRRVKNAQVKLKVKNQTPKLDKKSKEALQWNVCRFHWLNVGTSSTNTLVNNSIRSKDQTLVVLCIWIGALFFFVNNPTT
jgi:hypothetical protein